MIFPVQIPVRHSHRVSAYEILCMFLDVNFRILGDFNLFVHFYRCILDFSEKTIIESLKLLNIIIALNEDIVIGLKNVHIMSIVGHLQFQFIGLFLC